MTTPPNQIDDDLARILEDNGHEPREEDAPLLAQLAAYVRGLLAPIGEQPAAEPPHAFVEGVVARDKWGFPVIRRDDGVTLDDEWILQLLLGRGFVRPFDGKRVILTARLADMYAPPTLAIVTPAANQDGA